jgi:thiamine pyrophosphate-dependent acetolactate synthase large subunit-like protein
VTEQATQLVSPGVRNGGQLVVEVLRAHGVDTVFGLIGSATMELFDALYDADDIRFVGVRDERTGVHMADAYARTTGRPGVILAGQNGPGATNLVTGLAQALRAYSPVVALAGAISTEHHQLDGFQEVDQHALFTPVTKRTFDVVQRKRLGDLMTQAFRTALSPRPGPVLVNLHRDVLSQEHDDSANPTPLYRSEGVDGVRPLASPGVVERTAALLSGAQRPVIVAGGGVKYREWEPVTVLAELLGAPIVTSAGHGDAVPSTHPHYAGQMGPRGNPIATGLVKDADAILVLGSRLAFNSTFFSYDNMGRDAQIVQVEMDATALGRYFPVALGVLADAPGFAGQLSEALAGHEPKQTVRNWLEAFRAKRNELLEQRERDGAVDTVPIQPARVWKALRAVLPEDVIVTLDAGTLGLQAHDVLPYRQPPALITPVDFGLVGFSFAAGLGAKVANPDRTVVSLMGDGGFGMAHSEISTAVQAGINTTAIVLNNGVWGAEKAYQRDFYGGRYIGADVLNPPYDELARLYGAYGFRVEHPDDLEPVISEAMATDKVAVVDVKVDPDALYSFRRDSFAHRAGGGGAS